jgi:hypothetical protein
LLEISNRFQIKFITLFTLLFYLQYFIRMPRCPKGTRRNKQTGLCEPKPTQKPKQTKKVCPPGKLLNPTTNRCIKDTPANRKKLTLQKPKQTKKVCPPGKLLNPTTNRCIKDTPAKRKKLGLEKSCPPGKQLKSTACVLQKPIKQVKINDPIQDVLDNLITINGHGTFNPKKIKVPEGFQVLIPHKNGLDQDYTTPDAKKNKLFEEALYKQKYLNYRDGWKLYLPGDDINNLIISTFSDASSCSTIDTYHKLQKPLIDHCKQNGSFTQFCPLFCTKQTGSTYDYITYKKHKKLKLKACSRFTLQDVFQKLKPALQKIPPSFLISPTRGEPIVLIPFTCNAKQGSKMIPFDPTDKTKLNTIYQTLVKYRN